jgi:DNA-binding NarL/FixJ family response regulator
LEFGAGWHSTPMFLNRSNYPALERLVSIEADPAWRAALDAVHGSNKRWHCVERWDGSTDYDLIFIDDGLIEAERVKTIRAVAALKPTCPVVIHDFERTAYRIAADGMHAYTFVSDEHTPHTAVLVSGSYHEFKLLCKGLAYA